MQKNSVPFYITVKKLVLFLFIIATNVSAAHATPDSSFHIYLLMGQSNMAGRGYLTDSLKTEQNDKVYVLNKDMQWEVAHHPLHYDKPELDGVGPGLSFGIKMAEAALSGSEKIGLVPCAVGGTPIEHWKAGAYDAASDTHPYDDAVQRIKAAMEKGIICGVIWHQGESDSTPGLAESYMPQLLDLMGNIRELVHNPDLPFVAGELGRFYGPHEYINTQLATLSKKSGSAGVVSSEGLTDRGDQLHFDGASAEILGGRYAEKMQKIQQEKAVDVTVNSATGDYRVGGGLSSWIFSGSLGQSLADVQNTQGTDEAGDFTKVSFTWDSGNKAGSIRWYKNSPVIIFTITLPNGGNTALKGFPDFNSVPDSLYHFSYHDDHFAWPEFELNQTSTPWLLFDKNSNACIISPASQFMVAKIKGDGVHSITSTLNEEITAFPAGFSYSTIMVLDNGIRGSWDKWGTALRALYHRNYPDKDADPLLKYYGYWTDNGADYYYNYDTGIGYENTLLKLKQYYQDQHIPMGYMQLDSWWYEKSNYSATGTAGSGYKNQNLPRGAWNLYGGLIEYKADPFVFPDELAGFQKQLGVPLATHNRWIDPRSPYQQQYQISGIMSPDPQYWADIMSYIKSSGVTCYEQDWLDYIYRGSPEMQSTLTAGDLFTDGMANAAAKENINLQYCMAMPRYFLQGLKYNNLTTIRTSDDVFKNNKWRKFVFTSQLAYETGVMPWSDVFKSSELGNMILSVLSSGPVGTGDAIGKENKGNIMLACRTDGQLVRPDIPILPLDKNYTQIAAGSSLPVLAYTYTKHNDITTDYLFAFCDESSTDRTVAFTPDEIGMTGKVVVYNPIAKATKELSSTQSFTDDVASSNYNYYIIAPVTTSGIAFLGDSGKIAATGKERIASIEDIGNSLKATVLFAPDEKQVVIQGYCKRYVRANMGDVRMDQVSHVFSVTVDKPDGTDEAEIVFTPTAAVSAQPGSFATSWKTDNPGGGSNQIQFTATGNNFNIHWEDMFDETGTGDTIGGSGVNTISFPVAGTYILSITPGAGTFTGFAIGTAAPRKLLSVEQWGSIHWSSFAGAYNGATNMALNAIDTPLLASVTDMSSAFKNCSSLTANDAMNNWHTDKVTDMSNMFNGASAFNQAVDDWKTGNVTNLSYMFNGAKVFNQNLGGWHTDNVTNMSYLFSGASAFNQPIGDWNTANVTNMSNLLNGARAFNQPLGDWNTGKVTNIGHVLQSAVSFNQDISHWDLANVTNMAFMFYGASVFNQDVHSWNTAKVENMVSLLQNASSFNQDIGAWNLQSVKMAVNNDGSLVNMLSSSGMDCSSYSQTLEGWAAGSNTPANLTLGASGLSYDSAYAQAAHSALVDTKRWIISGDLLGHCSVTPITLPVTLLSFTGSLQHTVATLQWQTGVETDVHHFEIEARSSAPSKGNDATGGFVSVGSVPVKGNGAHYTFSVPQPQTTAYYRLKMAAGDGSYTYSDQIVVLSQNKDNNLSVYPNPAIDYINIALQKAGEIRIYNPLGKLLKTVVLHAGLNTVNISSFSAGVYFCETNGAKLKFIKK